MLKKKELNAKKLPPEFYIGNTLEVAKQILGKILVSESPEGQTTGRIVEVEAYIGPGDKASHAYNNLRSKRTEVQYGPGGYAYIYYIYGMYCCFNIVTQQVGKPEVVLLRAIEPIIGLDIMAKRRQIELTPKNVRKLTNGPGKLCVAMGINRDYYGENLKGNRLYLLNDNWTYLDHEIIETKRINIDYAEEAKDYMWRYCVKDSPYLSRRMDP